jgi:glyoxylate reductase
VTAGSSAVAGDTAGTRPRTFVARRIPEDGLRLVTAATDADVWDGDLPPEREELLRLVRGAEGILTMLTERVDDELLDAAGSQLKVVSNYAVGFDNIDVDACTRRGIPVGNTPGVLTDTTADLAFALLMAVARRIAEGYDYVRAGQWKTWGPLLLLGPDVHGATLGIVGFGRIGRAVARRATGFGMNVLYYDVQAASAEDEAALNSRSVSMDELLAESDFISLHPNLTPETRGLMNGEAFARMKRTAIVVNTSRGPVVDHSALYDALRDGVIAGAGLDVTDPEPLPADHPLLTLPQCLVVPHIASASHATRGRMAEMAAENLLAGIRGEPLPTCVNPQVYEGR